MNPGKFAEQLDTYLARLVPFGFSGALLVAHGDDVLVRAGYGLADRQAGTPNTPETVFCLGSITKPFTASAVMKLVEQGRLDPSDPISAYIAGVPEDKAGVTIHHLLTHTAGMLNYSGGDYEMDDHEHVLQRTLETPLQFVPGDQYAYSNAGYSVLAAIVEYVSRQPYEDFLYENLLAPAGMELTGYVRPDWSGRTISRWYVGETDNGHALEKPYPSWNILGNGEMLSTLDDMFRWHQALAGGTVLAEETRKKMFEPFLQDYGYGWRIEQTEHGRLVEHNGASGLGSSALFRRYLDAGLTIILFCNQAYGDLPMVLPMQDKIDQMLAGEDVPLPPEVGETMADAAGYAGTYSLPAGGRIQAALQGQMVVLTAAGQGAINMLAFPDLPANAHEDLNETTLDAFSAALAGDLGALLDFMANAERRAPNVKRMLENNMAEAEEFLGAFKGTALVGTVPSSVYSDALDTIIALRFEKGDAGLLSISRDGKNIGAAVLEISQGFVMPCAAHAGGLSGYHIPLGRTVQLEAVGAGGRILGLKTAGGNAVALKENGK